MFPLKKILCPVDFSVSSFEGLNVAKELAQTYSAELILIHVVQPLQAVAAPGVLTMYPVKEYYEEMAAAARKSFEDVVENRIPKGLKVRTKVVQGQPADEITREIQTESVDVVVIATHGWTGWRRFTFGSVTEKVVRLSTCPVVAVPAPGSENQ